MGKTRKALIVLLIMIVLVITFISIYDTLINDFERTAESKADLIEKHVQVSINIIDGLVTYGDLFFEQDSAPRSELYNYLEYDPSINSYNLDRIGGSINKKEVGNLTGLGPIPTSGAIRDELNLALQYNKFFRVYSSHFPDIAWLYYTSENDFIAMYPRTSSNEFRYSKDLKQVAFYQSATPMNNPQHKSIWTPVYLDAAGKGLMVTLSAPIYDKDTFKGVVSLDLTNTWLSKEINSKYECYLIDDSFTVMASGQKQFSNDSIDKFNKYLKLSPKELKKLINLKEHSAQVIGSHYIYTSGFDDTSWKLIFLVPIWLVIGKSIQYTLPILLVCILFLLTTSHAEKRKKSEALLAKKNDLMETTLYSIEEGIIVTDLSGKITLINKTAEEYTGWTNEDACGKDFQVVFKNIDTITHELRYNPVSKVLETGQNIHAGKNAALISKNGSEIYISGSVSAIRSESGAITGAVVSFRDITKEYEQEKQIEGFIELNFDMLCVMDSKGYYHKVNKKFEEVLGYKSEELEGKSYLAQIHEEDVESTIKGVQNFVQYQQTTSIINRFLCKDGTYKYIEWHSQPRVGKFIYSSLRDVTEQVMREEKLETIAGRDQLTGAYNRYHFDTIIEGEMERSDYLNKPLSIALIDMDHFKNVNDTLGHPVGDEVLKHTTKVINETIRDSDILIRFGGEEFVLLMPQTSLKGAIEASEKVRAAIENNPHPVAGRQTASFGVAERMKDQPFINWYHSADEALYKAKRKGRNCIVAADQTEIDKNA